MLKETGSIKEFLSPLQGVGGLGAKKVASYLHRTAQPFTLATFRSWGSSTGAGRIRLAGANIGHYTFRFFLTLIFLKKNKNWQSCMFLKDLGVVKPGLKTEAWSVFAGVYLAHANQLITPVCKGLVVNQNCI